MQLEIKHTRIMTTVEMNMALDRELEKIRGNKEAMRQLLDAARLIRLMYLNPEALANFEEEQDHLAEAEAERQFRSLRGCWIEDPEDAAFMEAAIREAREQELIPEINLDD